MKKTLKVLLVFLLAVVCAVACSCSVVPSSNKSIKSIKKTATNGLVDTYTITYTDGSTFTYEVTNGKDGEDGDNAGGGASFTIEDLYNQYLQEYPSATYEDFLRSLISVNTDGNAQVINKALKSSVKFYCEFTEAKQSYSSSYETAVYLGSGVIYKIDSDYTYFITNYHVVYDSASVDQSKFAKRVVCYLYGSESDPSDTTVGADGYTTYVYGPYGIECEVVGGSATADIAIVKAETQSVKAVNEDIEAITFAEGYHVGETAIAIGNPEGEGISVTEGIVSVDNEMIALDVDGTVRNHRSIRIDTAIYNGSSGGGLFNANGQLIGITNAGDGVDQNVNFAVPLEIVEVAVENIMYYASKGEKNAKKITLGVTVVSQNSKYVYNEQTGYGKIVEEVIVYSVTSGSICEQIGLKSGDKINGVIINGTTYTIDRNFHIGDLTLKIREGDIIALSITREGESITQTSTYTIQQSNLVQA